MLVSKRNPYASDIFLTISNIVIFMEDIQQTSPASSASPRGFQPFILPGAILIAAVIIAGTLLMTRGGAGGLAKIADNTPPKPVKIEITDQDHILGNKDAKVTIVEFSDFQCPFCRSFFEGAFAQVKTEYIDTGKARLVFRHFPLDFHPLAKPSAIAVECAAEQGKFWEMHDKIFQEQAKKGTGTVQYTTSDLKRWAANIKLNASQFNQCFESGKYTSHIDNDLAYASSINVSGTPSFFINGTQLVGAQPFASFKATIDAALK